LKLAALIVATDGLSTVTWNDVEPQLEPEPVIGMENPRSPESIRPVVPTGSHAAAEATDGNTNAHSAITAPKSNMLFFETIFNI
jgi:hypothetical protein